MATQKGNFLKEETLKKWVEKGEGCREQVYNDTEGNPTIGVGFNLNRKDAPQKIKELGLDYEQVRSGKQTLDTPQINQLLDSDIKTAIADAKSVIPNFDSLSQDRQIVLTDMAFNLGRDKLSKFTKMTDAIKNEDWEKAADEMQNSKWFNQVGDRGKRNVDVMRGQSSVEQHLTSDFSKMPTTNLQNPVDLESQKAAYQERYQQFAVKIMENPKFVGALRRDIDLGIGLSVDFTNAGVKFTARLSKTDNEKVEQPLTGSFSQTPTTNLQNPVDLESQKAAYQERYQQLAGKVIENPEFAGASSRDIDLGVAVCVVQERKQSSGNLNLEETNNEIAGILSQSSQVKEWKETLSHDDYLESSTAYIEDIQTSCQKIHEQDFDYCQE